MGYKYQYDFIDQEKYLDSILEIGAFFSGGEKPPSTKLFQFMKDVKNPAIQSADLAEDFSSGRQKLIPIVFSPGLAACWRDHQMIGLEMASNGFIVFMIDHFDGTCKYTEL